MDLNPFAVELARVTLMIARKVAIDKFNLTENSLPLDTLDDNIVCKDALFSDWVKADAIIGNPPFLGGKKLRQELGDNYTEKVYQQFPEVKGQTDFCVFWFRKAHNNLDAQGRAGLVGTNSISQNVSRNASLDYIVSQNGFIYEAVSTQVWSGEANVHVSIVNWSKEKPAQYFLDNIQVSRISTSLTNQVSVENAKRLNVNQNISFQSCELSGKGFIISEEEAQEWIKKDSKNKKVLKPMLDGKSLINLFHKKEWVIDFNDLSLEDASEYKLPFERVKKKVKPERDENKEQLRRENWWKHGRSRSAMRKALIGLSCYFAIPKIIKYILFQPVDISILPCEANMVIASQDFYILGILTSKIHRIWVKAKSSTLKGDTRYTNTTCFETFPFPQTATKKIVEKIRETMIKLHEYRTEQMEKKQWGITQLYNNFFTESSSQLYKLHQQLDKLAMEAYEFNPDDDLLEKLLKLNLELAEKEERGEKIVGCWDIYQ
jgi:type II restriction/modification system DNA methylase subunit YeeA